MEKKNFKDKGSQKGRTPSKSKRRKKSTIRKHIPVIAISALIVLFVLWRVLVIIPHHKSPSSSNPPSQTKEEKVETKKDLPKKTIRHKAEEETKTKKERTEYTEKPPKPPEIKRQIMESKYAIVIDDVGSSLELLDEATKKFPKIVTFAIIPFQKYSKESAELLHKEGFHIILHSPMEALESDQNYKVKDIIKTGMSEREVFKTLELQLESVPYAEGVNNHTGSKATKDEELMRKVMRYLKKKNLYFLDSRTTPLTVAMKVAMEEGVPTMERRVFFDDISDEIEITKKVDEFILCGEKEEKVCAIGHLRSNTIDVLSTRIPYWQKRGIQFFSLSDIIKKNGTGS